MQRATKAVRLASYEEKLLIDIYEASDLLGLKVSWLRKAVFRRAIPHRKIGSMVRFAPSELKEWLETTRIEQQRAM